MVKRPVHRFLHSGTRLRGGRQGQAVHRSPHPSQPRTVLESRQAFPPRYNWECRRRDEAFVSRRKANNLVDVIFDISESGPNAETYAVAIKHHLSIAYEVTET
ncbi:MAG: hypothetical protein IT336_03485 [Thermomicrobiales bacterium]|nr:hypothetical protein [Thermomicrobiales bacterium]